MKKFIKIFILLGFIALISKTYAFQIENEVYAIVGNKIILKSAIEQRANLENITFDSALKQLIEEDMLLYEADKKNIKVSSSQVNERLQQIEKGFPSTSEFETFLRKNGFSSIKKFKKYLKKQIKVENLIQEEVVSKIQILPIEISRKMESMNIGKMVMLRTISFNNKKDAQNFIKSFNKNPSEEIKKMQNIGWVNIDQLNSSVEKIVEKIPKGSFSVPLKNSDNWTLFYVEDIKENNLKNIYIQAREEIFKKEYPEKLDQYIQKLKKQIPITILNSE
ncbi:MAG: SurA N-terminal domain-containing protein [Candidatus Omnitrophica bacterium]|jgi:parvulin-like peptidyl-prolyl isomerase|nr:SurA N-terminal domain-containing protein [Candidatus Omnitrophota bacterium]